MIPMAGNSWAIALLAISFFLAAALYSSVGHGGASAYLAVMGFVGFAPETMKPVALTLNILVSAMALFLFCRAGFWHGRIFWPLAAGSVPAAFLGGWMQASDPVFKIVLALALALSVWPLVMGRLPEIEEKRVLPTAGAFAIGVGLGFVSGLIGVGGGIFLTPLLILFGWANTKTAAALSAAFILLNSISGLGGFITKGGSIPEITLWLLPTVIAGGAIGSTWGSGRAPSPILRQALAAVLIIAAIKFTVT